MRWRNLCGLSPCTTNSEPTQDPQAHANRSQGPLRSKARQGSLAVVIALVLFYRMYRGSLRVMLCSLGFARLYTGCFCQKRQTLKQFMWLFWLPQFFSYRPMKKGAEALQKQSKPKEQHTATDEHLRWPQKWPILLCMPVVRPYYLKDPHTPCTILQVMQGVPPCNFIDRKFCHSRHALQQATRLLLILTLYIYLFVFIGFI